MRPEQRQKALEKRERGTRHWLVMATHTAVFVMVMVLYPRLEEARPDVFDTNVARLVIAAWLGVVALHLLLAYIADLRFLRRRARLARIRQRLHPNGPAYVPPAALPPIFPDLSPDDPPRPVAEIPAPTSIQTRARPRRR